MSFLFIFSGLAVVNVRSPMSNLFRFLWASCGVTSGQFALWEKLRRGWYWWTPLGKPVRPELYSDSFRRLTLAARLGVIHLYLVRRTLAVAMDRAGVAPVDAAPPLATQLMLRQHPSEPFRAGCTVRCTCSRNPLARTIWNELETVALHGLAIHSSPREMYSH
jgi:hypothetical protein